MTLIPFANRRQTVLVQTGQPWRASLLSALKRVTLAIAEPPSRPWYLLNTRLLRDIGRSPLEAEIARSQFHRVEPIEAEPLAAHGLDPAALVRWIGQGRRDNP